MSVQWRGKPMVDRITWPQGTDFTIDLQDTIDYNLTPEAGFRKNLAYMRDEEFDHLK